MRGGRMKLRSTRMTNCSYPPKWCFGFLQEAWSHYAFFRDTVGQSYPAGHSGLLMSSHSSCSHEVSPCEETTVHHVLESKFNLHVTLLKMMICTFANGLVIWAAVSFFQAVLWAVAGMVFVPLLPTPIRFALKASLWSTDRKSVHWLFTCVKNNIFTGFSAVLWKSKHMQWFNSL